MPFDICRLHLLTGIQTVVWFLEKQAITIVGQLSLFIE